VATPPEPNTTSEPNTRSWTTPMITSVPPVIIGCMMAADIRVPNVSASTR
jgi:hypothetical protein